MQQSGVPVVALDCCDAQRQLFGALIVLFFPGEDAQVPKLRSPGSMFAGAAANAGVDLAKMLAQPAIDIYEIARELSGQRQDKNAPKGHISSKRIQILANAIAGMATAGSGFAAAPAGALRVGLAPRGSRQVFHGGSTPIGGKFRRESSNYDGDVFVAQDPDFSEGFTSPSGRNNFHALTLADDLRLFDFRKEADLQRARKWLDKQRGMKANDRADMMMRLRKGQYQVMEPHVEVNGYPLAGGDAGTINKFIRENYDGYYMREADGLPADPNIGIHRPASLFNPDGTTFYGMAPPVATERDDK